MEKLILRTEQLKTFYLLDMQGTQKVVKAVNEVDLTIYENLDFVARMYSMKNRRHIVNASVERLGLKERQRQLAGELSGGWKQRLALGCAILHEPSLLFLDEPTSGVDPLSRRRFWDLIYEMAHKGVTIFVTTHYMDEAEYCDRLALINQGKIIAL